jgi:hypothetical protein
MARREAHGHQLVLVKSTFVDKKKRPPKSFREIDKFQKIVGLGTASRQWNGSTTSWPDTMADWIH